MNKLNARATIFHGMSTISDAFAFGSSEIIDIYSNVINYIEIIIQDLKSKKRILCAETILTQHLTNNSIHINSLPLLVDLTRHIK